jgi:hypothetical protein
MLFFVFFLSLLLTLSYLFLVNHFPSDLVFIKLDLYVFFCLLNRDLDRF